MNIEDQLSIIIKILDKKNEHTIYCDCGHEWESVREFIDNVNYLCPKCNKVCRKHSGK